MLLALALMLETNSITKVDGSTYRVEVRGEVVRVYQKAVISKVSMDRRAKMRKAVIQATGCNIVDDYWRETSLEGMLACPSEPSRP